MMTLFALWNGGSSYGPSYLDDHLETFPSMAAAREAFADRANIGYWQPQTFTYANGRTDTTLTPSVDDRASMSLYLSDPRETSDPYPDRLVEFGPRGGVRVSHG
ncbi:MAG TPA: hypothetical protein VK735_39555 [Pseudonocardia sp.]|uniref:hypothetical protein n=1 Tax=Pseudonocardia sp. TaxID=60912 RepID=UPI002B8540F3|nr:hypothetical protein [Pseudonocardia sp.]HTF53579.1 hypothetical protein [Pseudonocardia sp.]